MPPAKKTELIEKAPELIEKAPELIEEPKELLPSAAVLLSDGGEAILLGIDGEEALLRCGTLHGSPIRRPISQLSLVVPVDETLRHVKFRREATLRGEVSLSEYNHWVSTFYATDEE